ncbi:hypothetical protein TREMEDRAFT_35912 [Tremella mesenterica DSM 1558]|uniref:uncharacterized protein n=1 Tax=Tremella mesenterica (strain ATCC 24925 / CBS 8224 / DSM 1558 / NBRC 9311 / NRRL Y-6157 / RJB 2259-6 / UBC 559-6) TaxID=578456 RepID=UPI00032BB0A0|nr:uncharacterized protein TREMEDRAFT_35912 [Tremella mesenterica DSM 1558]EIW65827.1 hypothetical protein TREMEDRAFT_35912 [Tremella mesenterica DSM 1558]
MKPIRRPAPKPGYSGRAGTSAKTAEDGYLYVAGVRDPSKRVTEFKTESDVCPVCHTDRQFNKNLRLLVSPCYHKMCESCIDRLFTLGPEPCPQCGRILRKVNFAHQTFEDLKVEKEIAVRRRMAGFFNKRQEDFMMLREYDDYLQEVEDLTFNLLNDIDVAETEARIADFRRRNAEAIAANQAKAVIEALSQAERDMVERKAREERMEMIKKAEVVEVAEEARVKEEIVEALAKGDTNKAHSIRLHANRAKASRAESLASAIPPSLAALYASTAPIPEGPKISPLDPSYHGPFVPIPYAPPEEARWKGRYELKQDYVDGRQGVVYVKEDKEGKVRGGGYDLRLFWEMEIRSAVEGLGVKPLREGGVLV